jgi:hypothetical protein
VPRTFASGVAGAWDPHGNQMGAPHTWWFATKATTPFTVTATNPEAGAVGVPLTATLVITFNKELLAGSEELVSFRLDLLEGPYEPVMVPGQVERQGRSLRFTPDEPLEEGAIYQARVLGAHHALSGKVILGKGWRCYPYRDLAGFPEPAGSFLVAAVMVNRFTAALATAATGHWSRRTTGWG